MTWLGKPSYFYFSKRGPRTIPQQWVWPCCPCFTSSDRRSKCTDIVKILN